MVQIMVVRKFKTLLSSIGRKELIEKMWRQLKFQKTLSNFTNNKQTIEFNKDVSSKES